jgi:hypothetical protein
MASLSELSEWEQQAKTYWIDCLMVVDEMLSMHADDPEGGCLGALREAQDEALEAGRKVRALQERIARLTGPSGPLPTMHGFKWPDTIHA